MSSSKTYRTLFTASAFALAVHQPAWCGDNKGRDLHLPRQDLATSLLKVGKETGTEILFQPGDVKGLKAPELDGRYSPEEAVKVLIQGTALVVEIKDGSIFLRGRDSSVDKAGTASSQIVVTGSRLRGAPIASPVISLSQKEIVDSGQTNMGDVVRTIPENFGGSQNPGANVNTPEKKGYYLGSGSSVDLRGLGGDATLTLLNGHRLAYSGPYQAIDISVIPIAALDRLEIVADGSSALYGSDAVAGVANVILKRDYNGLATSARFGASTDGGNQQQEYSVVGGQRWKTGGFMAAYDFSHNTPILWNQRTYTAATSQGLTLLPRLTQHNAILTGHQAITENLEFDLDGFYNQRSSDRAYATTTAGNPSSNGAKYFFSSRSLSVAPSLKLNLGGGWRAAISGVYSEDNSRYLQDSASNNAHSLTAGCYCNSLRSVEVSADGNLLRLPAGTLKLAVGGGYRSSGYHGYRWLGSPQDINVSQSTYYGFGEISVPLVSPDQNIPLIRKLSASGAVRYEDYPGVARVATPKFGIIYAPVSMFDLKASWGKSFKAPTFFERYSSQYASLYNPSTFGGTTYPAGSTVLFLNGGNPGLQPERATTWSVSASLHPEEFKGLLIEFSYFNVHYQQRIQVPIPSSGQSLIDPNYRNWVVFSPSTADVSRALAGRIFNNYTTASFNPPNVVAIINDTNLNAVSQLIHGFDISAKYQFAVSKLGQIQISGSGSYLDSNQQITASTAVTQLAGTVYNPPHFRGRAGAAWQYHGMALTSFVNYAGPVTDTRINYAGRSGPMTTIDLSAHYKFSEKSGPKKGLDVSASALNLFNVAPKSMKIAGVYDTPYDPLNYSPVGRFLSLTISKEW
ncbi:TonB-dependent receptor [Novosphingobium rosa]|uniref:TonB-dependent receptor n=1 Tax=Novosphingobium rosa TaxID=76978 RepID=UPI00082D1A0A|nr:TonB-dependent receptor [Novosphingobium rosa]